MSSDERERLLDLEYRVANLAENFKVLRDTFQVGGDLSKALLEHLGLEWKYVPEVPATHKLVKKEKK